MAWWPFPGYEDCYEITRDGRVRSKSRYIPRGTGQYFIAGREMKPQLVRNYPAIQTKVNGVRKTAYLHRAIATLFVPNPDGKPYINHIDGVKTNNKPENLEWCTHPENMRHAVRTGLATPQPPPTGPGEQSGSAKLNDQKVRDIKNRLRSGETQQAIADCYGVSRATIAMISCRNTWAHIMLDATP